MIGADFILSAIWEVLKPFLPWALILFGAGVAVGWLI